MDECGTHNGIGATDVIILQKAHCAEVCTIVSQFDHASIGPPNHSSSAQLIYYKDSATNLAIASDPSFLPSLAVFLSAPCLCDRPPTAPDPATCVTLVPGIFKPLSLVFKDALACHLANTVWSIPIFADPMIQAS